MPRSSKKVVSNVDKNRMAIEQRAEAARNSRERLWIDALDPNGTPESRREAMAKLAEIDRATRAKVLEAVGG